MKQAPSLASNGLATFATQSVPCGKCTTDGFVVDLGHRPRAEEPNAFAPQVGLIRGLLAEVRLPLSSQAVLPPYLPVGHRSIPDEIESGVGGKFPPKEPPTVFLDRLHQTSPRLGP